LGCPRQTARDVAVGEIAVTTPTKPFSSLASPTEKLDALFNEKALRKANRGDASTFQQFANSEAAQDAGRFAAVNKSNVVGAKPVPEYPAGPKLGTPSSWR
jgi:hypothetical protein